jgi:multidrug transporter EmrE-like cation transporter
MKTKDIFQYCLAALVVIGFFLLVYVAFIRGLPPENKEVAYLLVGGLSVVFTTVINYFFSSTKGSAEKTDIIAKSPALQPENSKPKDEKTSQ